LLQPLDGNPFVYSLGSGGIPIANQAKCDVSVQALSVELHVANSEQVPNLRGYVDVSDVGQTTRDWPQLNFIIYHSGYLDVGMLSHARASGSNARCRSAPKFPPAPSIFHAE
jgi:predicted TIM-barrel fold metal-dependent hydrolase